MRPFAERDIEPLLDYYYRSPRELPAMQAFDWDKFPGEVDYRKRLYALLREPTDMPTVTVEYNGRPVGVHLLNNMQSDQADFQAHFWSVESRGKGIGAISGFKACRYFFDILAPLKILYFRVPKNNPYSMRLVKKLPLKFVGEEDLNSPVFKPGIRAAVYSLTRPEFERLHSSSTTAANEDDDELDEIE